MSNSASPWTIWPAMLLHPSDFLGKNIGVAIFFSRGPSQSRDRTLVSHITGRLLTVWATEVALLVVWILIMLHLTIDGYLYTIRTSQVALVVKNPPAKAGDMRDAASIPGLGRSPGGGMATHSSVLAWRIPGTEEPGGLQSMGLQRVGHDWSDWAHLYYHKIQS